MKPASAFLFSIHIYRIFIGPQRLKLGPPLIAGDDPAILQGQGKPVQFPVTVQEIFDSRLSAKKSRLSKCDIGAVAFLLPTDHCLHAFPTGFLHCVYGKPPIIAPSPDASFSGNRNGCLADFLSILPDSNRIGPLYLLKKRAAAIQNSKDHKARYQQTAEYPEPAAPVPPQSGPALPYQHRQSRPDVDLSWFLHQPSLQQTYHRAVQRICQRFQQRYIGKPGPRLP